MSTISRSAMARPTARAAAHTSGDSTPDAEPMTPTVSAMAGTLAA